MEKEIYLVRHGQTDINVGDTILGHTDIPLNETGILQVEELAIALEKRHIKPVIISSPLTRTTLTASKIADRLGSTVEISNALFEIDFGQYEGKSKATFQDIHYGYNAEAMREGGAETAEDVEQRVQPLLEHIFQRPETTFLLVTHSFIASILTQILLNQPRDFAHIQALKNADYTYLLVKKQDQKTYNVKDAQIAVLRGRLRL